MIHHQIKTRDDAIFAHDKRRPRLVSKRNDHIRGEIARAAKIFEKRGTNQGFDRDAREKG